MPTLQGYQDNVDNAFYTGSYPTELALQAQGGQTMAQIAGLSGYQNSSPAVQAFMRGGNPQAAQQALQTGFQQNIYNQLSNGGLGQLPPMGTGTTQVSASGGQPQTGVTQNAAASGSGALPQPQTGVTQNAAASGPGGLPQLQANANYQTAAAMQRVLNAPPAARAAIARNEITALEQPPSQGGIGLDPQHGNDFIAQITDPNLTPDQQTGYIQAQIDSHHDAAASATLPPLPDQPIVTTALPPAGPPATAQANGAPLAVPKGSPPPAPPGSPQAVPAQADTGSDSSLTNMSIARAKWLYGPEGTQWLTQQSMLAKLAGTQFDPTLYTSAADKALGPMYGAATASATTAANYNVQPQTLMDKYTGQQTQFGTGALARAALQNDPDRWGAPTATPTVDLVNASTGAKVTFPTQQAAQDAIRAHPGMYGTPGPAAASYLQNAGTIVTVHTTAPDGTEQDVTLPYAQAQARFGNAAALAALNAAPGAPGSSQTGAAGQSGGSPTGAAALATGMAPAMQTAVTGIEGAFPGTHMTSGYRTAAQNAAVGGAANSAHMYGDAADFHTPAGMTGQQFAAAIQSQFPNVEAVYEGPGAANSTGPHVHVQLRGAPVQGGAQAPQSGGAQPAFGTAPSGAQTITAQQDATNYATNLSNYTNPSNIPHWQQGVQNGLAIKHLADTVSGGPMSEQIIQYGTALEQIGIHVPQGVNNLSQLQHFLALNVGNELQGADSNIHNQMEFQSMQQAISHIGNPSELIKFAGAVAAANNQYSLDYSNFLQSYQGPKTQSAVTKAWLATAEGRDGIYGVDPSIWAGATVNGAPFVKNFQSKSRGPVTAIWSGTGYKVIGGQ